MQEHESQRSKQAKVLAVLDGQNGDVLEVRRRR